MQKCPKCGTDVADGVKFCPECGCPLTQPSASQQPVEKKSRSKVGAWIKSHLKIFIPVVASLVVVIIMLSLIPIFIAVPSNGTYYESNNGKPDPDTYINLKNYKWNDDMGFSGKYKLSGKNIKIYVSMFGENEVYTGTVSNGVLSLDTDGDGEIDEIYVRSNHKHSYGGWVTDFAATCISEGQQTGTCACGHTGTVAIPKLKHGNEDNCSICGYPFTFELSYDGQSYALTGISSNYTKTEVTIPSVYNDLPVTSIGSNAFRSCSSLTSITIPNSVATIGYGAFNGCHSLTNITIPDSVTSIDRYAFGNCDSLTSITIPNSVTSIGEYAFEFCASLESITVAEGNTTYHSAGNCIIKTESKTLIVGCKNSVIPDDGSVTSIDDSAFYGCRSLTSITIPDSVRGIRYKAFEYCSGLTSITIPNSVTSIFSNTFSGCTSLTSITFKGTKEQWNAISKASDWDRNTVNYTVHCTDGDIAKQ